MSENWNLWDVKPPPVCTVKTALHFEEITKLNKVTCDALKIIRNLGYLDREAAILSRFLYRYRRILRHEKGIQNLMKVNQCLKRYLKLDMPGILFTFKQSLSFKLSPASTHAYLPTQQMLKWILLRFQAFSQVFARLIELTKNVGTFVYKKLCLGWAINLSLIIFSITARILATSKYLVLKSIEWYNTLFECLPFLQETYDFLPSYTFPTDLKLWLGKVDLFPLQKKTFFDKIFEFIDMVQTNNEERDEDVEIKFVNEKFLNSLFKENISNIVSEKDKKGLKKTVALSQYEDLGVPVGHKNRITKTSCKHRKTKKEQRMKIGEAAKKNHKKPRKYELAKKCGSASGS